MSLSFCSQYIIKELDIFIDINFDGTILFDRDKKMIISMNDILIYNILYAYPICIVFMISGDVNVIEIAKNGMI